MNWFINTFLSSFKKGETRISEKQFNIFMKYLKNEYETGYISGKKDTINGLKINAYEWGCISGRQYFVVIE